MLVHTDVAWELFPNHSQCKYLDIILISNFPLSPFLTLPVSPLCLSSPLLHLSFLYLASLFHMLTVWLGICWPPGGLNQSRASLTESAHTCPDRNDNDHGQSPTLCRLATVISLFWNANGSVCRETLRWDGCENQLKKKNIFFNFKLGLKYVLTYV